MDGANAMIRVQDQWIVSNGVGAGTLVVPWTFDGTLTANEFYYSALSMSNLGGGAFADFRACGDFVAFARDICVADLFAPVQTAAGSSTTVTSQTRTISIPFTYDVPFVVDWRLFASINAGCTFGNNCPALGSPIVTGGGVVDFGNTLILQPLFVFDSNGNQVFGASVTGDSGTQYGVAGPAAVPEPSTLLLLGTGMAAAIRRRLGRRNTQQG